MTRITKNTSLDVLIKETLEFYANESHYFDKNARTIHSFSTAEKDKGLKARVVLKQLKND